MKTLINIIFICLMLFASKVKSQDLIFYNNAKDTIKCKIIKDKVKYIEYKLNNDSITVYKIYQEQYDYYFQNNQIVKKQEAIIPDDKKSNRKNKNKKN